MADFLPAYQITLQNEGNYTYSNDPDDEGGETFAGLCKQFDPSWLGWSIIDAHKNDDDFPKCLEALDELKNLVAPYYKYKYWKLMSGDKLKDQDVANKLFDSV